MRIVAWNCNGGLHSKFAALLALKPDIAIIAECADPEKLADKCELPAFSAPPIWTGRDRNKGLGVFFFGAASGWCDASAANGVPANLRWAIPVRVESPRRFNLLAMWALNKKWRKTLPADLRLALDHFGAFLSGGEAVLAGDLNNNATWDKGAGWVNNHADADRDLARLGLVSAWHAQTGEQLGEESVPTIFWQTRQKDGQTYHIDFIYMPRVWADRRFNVTIGDYESWIAPGTGTNGKSLSDHAPLVLEVDSG